MGANISARLMPMALVVSAKTAGAMKWPCVGRSSLSPPVRRVAPSARPFATQSRLASSWPALTTGPIWVPSSSAWPTRRARVAAISFPVNSASTLRCTISREAAVHFCPVPPKAALQAWATARSMSQSSMMSMGFFDPISICSFARFVRTRAAMPCPTSTDPVKVTAATSGWPTSASPTARPAPITMLKVPAGSPARAMTCASATAEAGVRFAGFQTTALP